MTKERSAEAPGISGSLLLVLGLLSAIAPIAIDLYLPSFPNMTVDLRASASAVQLTLTGFLVGMGAGQLVFGPLSDRYGRKPPLVVGALLCVVASVAAALAPSAGFLAVCRVFQGFGGAAGVVIGRAVITDLVSGKVAARAFSLMMTVSGFAPVAAPVLGSVLAPVIGWRGILWVVFALAVLVAVVVVAMVPETRSPQAREAARQNAAGLAPLLSRTYLGYAAVVAFGFATMMSYIASSPFVYQSVMGLSKLGNGLLFGANALCLTACGALSARLSHRFAPARLLAFGLAGALAGSIAFAAVALSPLPVVWLAPPLCAAVASLGFVFGNATALAMGAVSHAAGSASAFIGALQFTVGALVSPLAGLGGEHTAVPLAAVMVGCAVIAACCGLVARSGARQAAV
ncbi:MAG: multidrug effflux MFS transporter [Segniliparus sp.]|uniref:multidrug effflux MFS transporter n=1 Tax=Segniliparus sp. TaxID=2804064 RepID=UPI003F2C9ED9